MEKELSLVSSIDAYQDSHIMLGSETRDDKPS